MFQTNEIKSKYNNKKFATKAFEELIYNAEAKCIIFHYTDKGLINMEEAKKILQKKGTSMEEFYFDSKGYSTIGNTKKCQYHIIKVCL